MPAQVKFVPERQLIHIIAQVRSIKLCYEHCDYANTANFFMTESPFANHLLLAFCCIWMSIFTPVNAEEIESLAVNDDAEIDILHIGEFGHTALIWFACNQGEETAEFATARNMVDLGYQTFFPDMLSAHFLSPTASNIGKVPVDEVVQVIQHIIEESDTKQLFLVAGARAAVPVLKGLADTRVKAMPQLKGALLITPRINKATPVPGSEPVYIDAIGHSRHPIRVLEGERTPNRWGLAHLKQSMSRSGSMVSTDLIKGVRGFFYLREDKTADEEQATQDLHHLIDSNIQLIRAGNNE